jgi:transcriptional regulator with XRE-family HTH domain
MEIKTKVKFVSLNKVTVETPQGDRFTLGLSGAVPIELQEQDANVIAYLFDKYYKGDPSVIMGPIYREMVRMGCWATPYWYGPDRNNERERIGAQIRKLREERRLEAKELAQYADIDASNLSRIEKGKFSAGLDVLCKIAAAMDCSVEIVPIGATGNHYMVNRAPRLIPEEHRSILITAKRSTFLLSVCLAKYGEFHWQQTRFNINIGDIVYIYVSEDREIKYKMTVERVDEHYDYWMAKEEEFWVDKERIQDESQTKYALLRLVAESHSGKLTEENLQKHGFLRAPQGIKYLDGELLKFIERKF